jgi:hypothetical protein
MLYIRQALTLHLAAWQSHFISACRFTGEVIDKQVEVVSE